MDDRWSGRELEDLGGGAERWRRMHEDRRREGPAGYNDSGPVQGGWTFDEDRYGRGARDPGVGSGYGESWGAGRRRAEPARYPLAGGDYPYGPHTPYGYRGRNEYDPRGYGYYGAEGPARAREERSWVQDAEERVHEAVGNGGEHRGRGPRGYRRSDGRIEEDVHDRLTDDPWLDASAISVKVKDCEVTLDGTVLSRQDKHRAENLVEQVSGVAHVQNNLRVDASPLDPGARTSSPRAPG